MYRILMNGLLLFITVILLAGCGPKKDYDYFLQHPDQLETEYKHCSLLSGQDAYTDPECIAAINAAQKLRPLILQAINQPLGYGNDLLNIQMQLASAKEALNTAKQMLADLQHNTEQTSTTVIDNKKQEIKQLESVVQQQTSEVNLRLAIIGLLLSQMN